MSFLLTEAKTNFLSHKICENKDDKKRLFETAKDILFWKDDPVLPMASEKEALPNDFERFFVDKVVKIRNSISDNVRISALEETESMIGNQTSNLSCFQPATEDEIYKLVSKSSNASCELDPLSTPLIKLCKDELVPSITKIVNLSLIGSEVPKQLKSAIVRPLLKKASLDPEQFKNYRPVSNLSFVSKIIENVVATRITTYLNDNSLLNPFQSAYKRFHSTETALLRVHNDLITDIGNRKMAVLILLDLSAAFDTIHHDILKQRLTTRYGIDGAVLKWISSYLSDRSQRVSAGGILSEPVSMDIGVSQGSVLGQKFSSPSTLVPSMTSRKNMGYVPIFTLMNHNSIFRSRNPLTSRRR